MFYKNPLSIFNHIRLLSKKIPPSPTNQRNKTREKLSVGIEYSTWKWFLSGPTPSSSFIWVRPSWIGQPRVTTSLSVSTNFHYIILPPKNECSTYLCMIGLTYDSRPPPPAHLSYERSSDPRLSIINIHTCVEYNSVLSYKPWTSHFTIRLFLMITVATKF